MGKWNLSVFYIDLGDKEATSENTLLLLHGFPESSYSWHKVVNVLLTKFERIVLFDFPGFGRSDKDVSAYPFSIPAHADVALAVWRQAGVLGGHLLSHDMADSVATELVAREVEGSLPNWWFMDGFQSYTFTNGSMVIAYADLRVTQKILLSPFGKLFSQFIFFELFQKQVRSAHGNYRLSQDDLLDLWENGKLQNGNRKANYLIRYYKDRLVQEKPRWLPALGKTDIPIHLCWGDKDKVAPVEMAHFLKREICPQAKLTVMKGLGHFCQLGSPEEWAKSVLAFYNRE
jgi:pimeloyl-ACP methyl ester carboxylesterase